MGIIVIVLVVAYSFMLRAAVAGVKAMALKRSSELVTVTVLKDPKKSTEESGGIGLRPGSASYDYVVEQVDADGTRRKLLMTETVGREENPTYHEGSTLQAYRDGGAAYPAEQTETEISRGLPCLVILAALTLALIIMWRVSL